MTIPSTARKAGPFDGTGVQTEWPFTFKVFTETDVKVVIADEFGVTTDLVYLTDFTVDLNADQETSPGGTVTYPISGTPLPDDGSVLSIAGNATYEQALDLPSGGNFSPLVIENALDAIVMQIQQLAEEISRAARLPITNAEDAESLVADIVVLADNVTNMQTLVANIADIVTVADDLNEPVSEIATVAASIDNVDTVGLAIAAVNVVAAAIAAVNTVSAAIANVNTVAGSIANVNTTAGSIANVNTVAGSIANVNTVAANIVDVGTVAGISADVSAVAAVDTEVGVVSGIAANVTTVAGISGDVTTVAGISADVQAVENISANVTTVADNIADVTAVADNEANIDAVAGNATNINTVATNISSVNTTAANMAAVIDAPNQASAAAASAVSAANSAAAAATALDNFDDRYLGQKTADPTLDNDGNALVTGALYFNSSTGKMRVYTGTGWIDASSASVATLAVFDYVATAGQSTFSGNDANGVNLTYTVGALVVSLNGSVLKRTDYTASTGSSIVLGVAANAGDELTVYAFGNFQVADTYSQAAADAKFVAKSDPMGFKNRIINGAMMIDQRNAGASVTPTDAQYVVDRFMARLTQASKISLQQVSTAPAGFVKSLQATSLSAFSVGASDRFSIEQNIEGLNVADLGWGSAGAAPVTLSFWVRSSLTGTFSVSLINSAASRSYPITYTISSANTWEQKSITVPGDTSGTWLTDNGIGIRCVFNLGAGASISNTSGAWTSGWYPAATGATSVVGTNGATFYITGVQLEKGSTATSFDYRPYGTELALCQRYYFSTFFSDGATPSANVCGTTLSDNLVEALGSRTPVTMRANPTFTIWNANTGTTGTIRISGANIGVSGLSNVRPDGFSVISLSASGSRVGIGGYSFTASAEL